MPESTEQPKKKRGLFRLFSGKKSNVRAPLSDEDAFRCAHWIAAMAFLRVKTKHTQSVGSWIKAKWHEFAGYTWKHEKKKMFGNKAFSLGTSATASLSAWGITTAIGGVVGSAGGPLGTIIGIFTGAAVGAVVGAVSAAVAFTGSLVAERLQYKAGRKAIYDRLTKSNYDYRKDFEERIKNDSDAGGHWYVVTKENETLEKIIQVYEDDGLEFETVWSHEKNKKVVEYCKKTSPLIVNSQKILKKKLEVWIPIRLEKDYIQSGMRNELLNLSYLVKHSLRDSVVHLRQAVSIHRDMVKDEGKLTGGVHYVPGENETIDEVVENVRKLYPKLRFTITDIIYHEKNKPQSYWYETQEYDTLSMVANKTKCTPQDIFEHVENHELQEHYIKLKIDPRKKDKRRDINIDHIKKIYIPCGLPEEKNRIRVQIKESGGQLVLSRNPKPDYVPAGVPIWIPSVSTFTADSFKNCDQMISLTQPVFEFTHHLNKTRNYVLPCLNLCRMYLDIFDEMTIYRSKAQEIIEGAVLQYMKEGDHKRCYLVPSFDSMESDYRRAFAGSSWYSPIWHIVREVGHVATPPFRRPRYKCIRTALRRVKQKGRPTTYNVSGDTETFETIAQQVGVPAQALAAHNAKKHRITEEAVKYDEDKKQWEIKQPVLKSGTVLEIPPNNRLDKILYHWVWEKIGLELLGPQKSSKDFATNYKDKNIAQIAIAEIDIDETRKIVDDIIDKYYKDLEKNRERHQKNWDAASPAMKRFYHYCGDVLHQHDMPGAAKRVGHLLRNLNKKTTVGEKTEFGIKGVLDIFLGGFVAGGVGGATSPGLEALGFEHGASKLLLWGVNPVLSGFSQASVAAALSTVNQEGGKIIVKEGVQKGISVTEQIIGGALSVVPRLVNLKYEKNKEKRIAESHILDFRRERIGLAALEGKKISLKQDEKALKEAAKEVNDSFVKISRHFLRAWHLWFEHVYPRIEKVEANEKDPNRGLTGCRDSYRYLRDLYEFRHELDKAERYLLGALSLSFRIRGWEAYLTEIENDVWKNLEEAAGGFIKKGRDDHKDCRKFSIPKRHCYGASENDPGKAQRPLMDIPEEENEAA
ncbi:MAG: hypothetical protein R3F48_10990 [Candidatus Zixiibacteriota bacterium]